jgi:exopolysaccharide production protein ExoZ
MAVNFISASEQEQLMKKLDSLQLGRAVAVISILVFHLTGLSLEYQHGCFYGAWTQVFRAGVDIFFVISGVVMVVTTYRKLEQPGTSKRFLIHRVSRIYPPYLFLTVILTLLWIGRPEAVNSKTGVNLFSSYTLWPSNKLPLIQVGWTLSFELMFYFAFFLIIVFAKKARMAQALIFWSAAVLAGQVAIDLDSSGMLLRAFPRANFFFSVYVLEFVGGCFIGLAFLKSRLIGGRNCVVAGIALFLAESVVFEVMNFDGRYAGGLRVLLFGVPSALLVYGLLAWEADARPLKVPRWAVRCGDMSYSIYLVHLLIIHSAYRFAWQPFNHIAVRPLFLVVTAGASIFASLVFHALVEIPFSVWTRMRLEEIFKVPGRVGIGSAPVALVNPAE